MRVALRLDQRRLAEEDVGVTREADQRGRRRRVSPEYASTDAVVLDAEPARGLGVVRDARGVTCSPLR